MLPIEPSSGPAVLTVLLTHVGQQNLRPLSQICEQASFWGIDGEALKHRITAMQRAIF